MATATQYVSVRTKEGTPRFRRGGQSFTREPTVLATDSISEDDLKAIREDEMLEVEDISEQEALKRGLVTDGRLPLEKAFGDYPPPGQEATSGVTNPPENPARTGKGTPAPIPPSRPAVSPRAPTRPDGSDEDESVKKSRK